MSPNPWDHWSFLACPHPDRQQIWKELHDLLYMHQITNGVSNVFHNILAFGLYQGCQASTNLTFNHLPHDLHHLYQAQEHLKWKQIYYGHISKSWIILLGHYHPQVNGRHYLEKSVTMIWQLVHQVWALWNNHLHPGNHEQEDCSQLQAGVNQIFFEASQDPLLHALVENIDPEQIMAQPTHQIQQWVTNSNNHMWAHSKAVKLQAHLCTRDICQYFLQHTTQTSTAKNLLHPP